MEPMPFPAPYPVKSEKDGPWACEFVSEFLDAGPLASRELTACCIAFMYPWSCDLCLVMENPLGFGSELKASVLRPSVNSSLVASMPGFLPDGLCPIADGCIGFIEGDPYRCEFVMLSLSVRDLLGDELPDVFLCCIGIFHRSG